MLRYSILIGTNFGVAVLEMKVALWYKSKGTEREVGSDWDIDTVIVKRIQLSECCT